MSQTFECIAEHEELTTVSQAKALVITPVTDSRADAEQNWEDELDRRGAAASPEELEALLAISPNPNSSAALYLRTALAAASGDAWSVNR